MLNPSSNQAAEVNITFPAEKSLYVKIPATVPNWHTLITLMLKKVTIKTSQQHRQPLYASNSSPFVT